MSKIRGELRQLSPARRLLGLLPVLVVALAVAAALGGVGVAGAAEPMDTGSAVADAATDAGSAVADAGSAAIAADEGSAATADAGSAASNEAPAEETAETSDATDATDAETTEPAAASDVEAQAVAGDSTNGVSLMASYDSSAKKLTLAQGEQGNITDVSYARYYDWRVVDDNDNAVAGLSISISNKRTLTVTATASANPGTYKIQQEYRFLGTNWSDTNYTVEVTAASTDPTTTDYGSTDHIWYYLNFNALPEGSTSLNNITSASGVWVTAGQGSINTRSMMDSAQGDYASRIYNIGVGSGQNGQDNNYQRYVYGGGLVDSTTGMITDYSKVADLNVADRTIRGMANGQGVTVNATDDTGTSYTYTLGSVPTDQEAVQAVQNYMNSDDYQLPENEQKKIKINENEFPAEAMTTANFTPKWYVVKDAGNGFHVDGYLVAKTAYMKVTKTFSGNNDAITAVKGRTGNDAYSISVADSGNSATPVHNNYSLSIANGTTERSTALTGTINYDSTESNPSKNYYVWYVPVDYQYDYALTEQNWQAGTVNGFTYESTASSTAVNSADSTTAKTGNDTITVRGTNSASSAQNPLTVAFTNIYTPDGTVAIHKVDSTTGNGWAGVNFDVAGQNGVVNLTQESSGYYVVDQANGTTSTVTTDAYGMIYLKNFPSGFYTLTEQTPEGYKSIGTITVYIASSDDQTSETKKTSAFTYKSYASGSSQTSADPTAWEGASTTSGGHKILKVTNTSETAALKAQKVWNLRSGESTQRVTLGFLQNGNAFNASNMTISSYGTDNKSAQTAVTYDSGEVVVPLYIEGKLANYTAQELKIGDTSISEGSYGGDGYRNYNVTQTTQTVTNDDGTKTVLITVTNEYDHGDATFRKVDESGSPVSGATFTLFGELQNAKPDASAEPPAAKATDPKTATSGADGKVTFPGLFKDFAGNNVTGYYYMKETIVPDKYDQSAANDIYLVERTYGGITLYKKVTAADGTASWQQVRNVVNNTRNVTLTIRKNLTGEMADTTKTWNVTVTGPDGTENTETIKDTTADGNPDTTDTKADPHVAKLTFKYGDKVSVSEAEAGKNGYKTTYSYQVGNGPEVKNQNTVSELALNGDTTVTVNNDKQGTPVTGIKSAGIPTPLTAVGIAAFAIAGGFALVRRNAAEAGAHMGGRKRRW